MRADAHSRRGRTCAGRTMWRLAQASWRTTAGHPPYNGEIAAAAGIGTSCSSSRNKRRRAGE
eukprot:5124294-Alexandrium_andersonii.AAC.1